MDLWGAKTQISHQCGTLVIVNQPAENVTALQPNRTSTFRRVATRPGRIQIESPVGSSWWPPPPSACCGSSGSP